MNFINKYSWKSFLSIATKDVKQENGFYWFKTQKSKQLLKDRPLEKSDFEFLKTLMPFNYFYFSLDDINLLQTEFKIEKGKDPDIGIEIQDLSLRGKKYRDIRNYLNRYEGKFEILDNFKDIKDIYKMLERWDDTCGDKYFQVRTGKNRYYFSNNFHKGCINTFVYDKDDLISFAILSPGECSSYILGKALCLDYHGLSEFTDMVAYKKANLNGVKVVNLGGGSRKLREYKKKFPHSFENETYDGKVLCLK